MRKAGYGEEVIADVMRSDREGAARAEEALVNAKKLFEEQGFQVSGTVYEKGANGEWQPGHFTLVGEGSGYTINYDSAMGASVTYHKTAEGDAAPSPEPAKDLAAAKAAEVDDIFDKAAKQVEQYNRLLDALTQAIDRFRQSNDTDTEADAERHQVQAKLEAFTFDSWELHLQLSGFQVAEPLIKHDDQGRAVLSQGAVTGHFDGINVTVGRDPKTGTTFYRTNDADGWQALDAPSAEAKPASPERVNVLA